MPFSTFPKYVDVTADSTQVDSDQTDIIAWFDLSNAPDPSFWDALEFTDGRDIRVTNSDGTTEYPAYVLFIDTTAKTGLVAAKVADLDADADTDYRMYLGDPAATMPAVGDTNGRNATFDWRYEWAFGMFNTGNGGDDLTGNGHDATVGSNLTVRTSNIPFGKGLDFPGAGATTDRFIVPHDDATDSIATETQLWAQYKDGTASAGEDVAGYGGPNRIRLQTGAYRDRINGSQTTNSSEDPDDTIAYMAFVKDGANDENVFFVDGAKQTVGTSATTDWPADQDYVIGGGTSTQNGFNGGISLWLRALSELADDTIEIIHAMWADASFWDWGTVTDNPDFGGDVEADANGEAYGLGSCAPIMEVPDIDADVQGVGFALGSVGTLVQDTFADIQGEGFGLGSVNPTLEIPDVDADTTGEAFALGQVGPTLEVPDVDASAGGEGFALGEVGPTLETPSVTATTQGEGIALGRANPTLEVPDVDSDAQGEGYALGQVAPISEPASVSAATHGEGYGLGNANPTLEVPDVNVDGAEGEGYALGQVSAVIESPSVSATTHGFGQALGQAEPTLEVSDVDVQDAGGIGFALGVVAATMELPSVSATTHGEGYALGSLTVTLEVPDLDVDSASGFGQSLGQVSVILEDAGATNATTQGEGYGLGHVSPALEIPEILVDAQGFGQALGQAHDIATKVFAVATLSVDICNPMAVDVTIKHPMGTDVVICYPQTVEVIEALEIQ